MRASGVASGVSDPAAAFVGKTIAAMERVDELVVLELTDGSQLQFRAKNGELEVGAHVEPAH